MSEYVLELKGITKIFPGVKALDRVSFSLKPGEIHALMGENGAGKSTFIKVITGVHHPEEGEMFLDGQKVDFHSPKEASAHSIAAIYQHGTMYPHLSVTENIFMGHEILNKVKLLNHKAMHDRAEALLRQLGSDVDVNTPVGDLTVAEQQVVEIAKAISQDARIIIMDEPTAALSQRESEELYRIAEKLRDEGRSLILITHRFEDMYRLASRVTVFRDAQYIGTWNISDISHDQLITAMVGREITQVYPKHKVEFGEEIFRMENFSRVGYFKDVDVSVRRGEILAMTGLVGAGRSEVMCSMFGIDKPDSGKTFLEGKEVTIKCPEDAMKLGIGYMPEDRQRQGLILDWGIGDNITLGTLDKYTHGTIINRKEEHLRAKALAEKVKTKVLTVYDTAKSLSGGNQQKIVVAKALDSDLKVLILDEPTKGVDVGARAQIYEIMSDLAQSGYGVIMISSDLPEVLGMADTILVMKEGRVSAKFPNGPEVTQETILRAAMNS